MGRGEQVDDILTECFIRLGQHIGEFTVSGEAARFWRARYRERFAATLAQEHPRAWSDDRLNVLAKAASLGRLAAEFAASDGTLVIGEGHARRASEANDCRPRSRYGMFSIWCLPPNKRREKDPAAEADGWWARQAQRVFHAARLVLLVAFISTLAVSSIAYAQASPYDPAREDGALSRHGLFSLLPWEAIDDYSGNVMLTFPDFVLPGNAGINLVVRRVYNSKDGVWRFDLGMPRISYVNGAWPVVINGDGSTSWLLQDVSNPDVYYTTSFWRYTASTRVLESPAGIKYEFDANGLPLHEGDVFDELEGTGVDVTWVNGRIDHVVQALGNSQSREVDFTYDAAGNVASVSCNGRTWQYTWASGNLVEAIPPVGPSWQFAYSTQNLGTEMEYGLQVTTPTGAWVQYVSRSQLGTPSDPNDRRWGTATVRSRESGGTDVTGGAWNFAYSDNGTLQITTVDGASGVVYHSEYGFTTDYWDAPLSYAISGSGSATARTDYGWQAGVDLGTAYQESGTDFSAPHATLPSTVATTQSGRTYTRTYTYVSDNFNNFGQPSTVTDSGDYTKTTNLLYQHFSNPTFHGIPTYLGDRVSSTTVAGVTSTNGYDPNTGFMTSGTSATGASATFAPDEFGNVYSQTVGGSQTTTFDHSWGVVSGIHAPQLSATLQVNPDGTVLSQTVGGHTTSFGYDGGGRQTSVQPPLGNPVTTTYASDGTSVTVARGSASRTTCLDGFGRTTFTFNSAGARVDLAYDAMGRIVRQSAPYTTDPPPSACSSAAAPAPPSTLFEYDALGRLTKRTNADGTFTTNAYDSVADGLRTQITDENNHTTIQILQAAGSPSNARLASLTNAGGQTTTYAYNGLGELQQVTAPGGLSKVWGYNTQGQLLSEIQPESGTTIYTYDAFGRLSTKTDALGQRTTYGYDLMNRLTSVTAPDPSYSATVGYDPSSGTRTSVSNGYVSSTFQFDADNRMTGRTDVIAGHTFQTTYAFDDNDNLTDLGYPSGHHVTYAYDAFDRLSRVYDDARGLEFARDFAYTPSGALASYTSGNGIVNTVEYNDVSEPTHVASSNGVVDLTYTYDAGGNVTGILDPRPGMTAGFGYDALDRLTSATGAWGALGYQYDALGNRLSSSLNGVTTSYTYDPATNRLASTSGGHVESFAYDLDGRLTSDSLSSSYAYTPSNQLEAALTQAGALNLYRYDADGQRVLKIAGGGLSTTTVVNGLSELSTEGGPITWTVDYVYAGRRLLAAVRPAAGTLDTLTVVKAGAGAVSAVPAGLDCGPDCSARYRDGTAVTLTAVPAAGFVFGGWSGACSGTSASATVTRSGDASCTATFTALYTLQVTKSGPGTVTSAPAGIACGDACIATYTAGTVVTLTATPASGYVFVGWTGTGCTTGTVPMSQATTCMATFGHRLTVSARLKSGSPYTDVQWTSSPAGINCWTGCAANFPSGTVVTLYTSEMPSSWSGDCSLHQSLTMDGDKTCIAIFNNYLGPIRLGAQAPTAGSGTDGTASVAPQLETAAPAGESGPVATFSAVEPAASGATLVTTSMDTPTTLQVVEYYHLDALGSVRALTDADGNVIARHDFLPFGEELSPQNPPHDRKLFTGQERDFETGLDYFYARQLRTDLGRFTAPDPMTDLAWTDPVVGASNAYAYVGGNPLGFIDPSGAQGEQIVVHPNWWDRFLAWLSGPLVFRSGVEVCISCNSSPGPSSLVGGITGSAGTVGFGYSEPSHEPSQQPQQTKKKAPCLPQSALTPLERAELTAARFWASQTGKTVGFGMGASGGFGVGAELGGFGAGGGMSGSISADAYGNAARITSYSFNALSYGAGVLAGLQVSYSPVPLSSGPSAAMQFSGSYGSGLGAGFTVDPVRGAGTATFGVGYGARFSGSVSGLSFETTTLICR